MLHSREQSSEGMETTFDVGGNTVSTPVATPAVATGAGRRFGSTTDLHLIGRPLPGMASDMRWKSVTDIRHAAAKEQESAMSRATSSEVLSRL